VSGPAAGAPGVRVVRDALRLAFGTLTALPVRPPSRVDRGVAAWAMGLAPLVGTTLGAVAVLVAWAAGALLDPLLVAVLVVGVLASLTRLIHWDGLADTADGLGSGRPADEALAVMRRSDIGPFGVFAIVAVFAAQVAAVVDLLGRGALGGVLVGVLLGRGALVLACRSGVPAARPEGLGAAVAGSVGPVQLVAGALVTALALAVTGVLDPHLRWPALLLAAASAAAWAAATTAYLRRRLGGMTGDTLGALVETTTSVALVVLAAAAH
jgi:adenosylcobinamide-GDP ribazoletransferase